MRRNALVAVLAPCALALSLTAAPALAQQGQSAARDTAGKPPVPQTFDWYKASGVPATTSWGQAVDTASTRQILSWTTMPEYTSPLVDYLPETPGVVSPTQHFGYPIGKPGVLHDVDQIYGYYKALAASTPRVRFQLLGETEEGNHMALVQVGSQRNLNRLDAIREAMATLADPRTTTDSAAKALIASEPVIYTFYAGLHSAETGPPEMAMELAYRLAASDDPMIKEIRDSVVVFIIPVTEADGRNRVVDWYHRYNTKAYKSEDEVPGPPYWGHYILHDNNRDGLQMSLRLTQILIGLALKWHYPIGHDLHESVPYLYTSTGTGPYNNQIDPITIGEWQWWANYEVTALTAYGMPGVWTHGFYDGWYPGYMMWVTNNDLNAMGRFYETFGNGVPLTQKRTLPPSATSVEWYRPDPPRKETLWSLRNNTNYMETGALTALSLAAGNRTRILNEFWTKSKDSLHRGRTEKPYAWVVPQAQLRPADAAYMLNNLRRRGIEISQATAAGRFGDVAIAKGDYVVRMDQPYRNYVQTLMEVQHYPENAPRPYDDVAWTFPLMFNVEAHAVGDSAVLKLPMQPVGGAQVVIPATITSRKGAAWYLLESHASAQSIRAWLALRGSPTYAAEAGFVVGRDSLPPGTWMVPEDSVAREKINTLARDMGVQVIEAPARAVADVRRHALDAPRIALLHTWRSTQDDGSVRVALDRMAVPYAYVGVDKLRDGMDLRSRFDVVLMANQGGGRGGSSGKAIFEGIDRKWSPLAYTRSAEYPSLGIPDSSSDITGGIGYTGMKALQDFVNGGGTFIALGTASTLPVDLGMVRQVRTTQPRSLFVPGSVVRGVVKRPESPIVYGYEPTIPLYHHFGPYFAVDRDLRGNVVVSYASKPDSVLMSGLANNPAGMAGDPAVIVVPEGKGFVVLYGFDPMHRFQSQGDFALVWNAVMNWNDLGVGLGKPEPGEAASDGGRF